MQRLGVIEQTRRHSIIAHRYWIKHIVVAINKMDMVDYGQERFNEIKSDSNKVAAQLNLQNVTYIP